MVTGFSAFAAPKYGPTATLLRVSHEYIRANEAPDYWALSGNYVSQITGSSCSSAAVTMVLNALRDPTLLKASDELVTQKNIHSVCKIESFKKGVSDHGSGQTISEIEKVLKTAVYKYGIKNAEVSVIYVIDQSPEIKAIIHKLLVENEKSADGFLIANFLQSEFTGDPEGKVGHMAPVAAYDEVNKRVLIMDPDRDWYEPYWVTEDAFINGLNTKDSGGKQFRGLIYIKKGKQ